MNEINEADESIEEAHFRKHIFYVVLDNVIRELTVCFSAAKQISDTFSFLWNYQEELKRKAAKLAKKYLENISSKENNKNKKSTRRPCAGNKPHNNDLQCQFCTK